MTSETDIQRNYGSLNPLDTILLNTCDDSAFGDSGVLITRASEDDVVAAQEVEPYPMV